MSATRRREKKRKREGYVRIYRNEQGLYPLCSNCGNPGSHFCPPSLGEPGFFGCTAK